MVGYGRKKYFSNFCHLIRVENEKCSEMSIQILKIRSKIEKKGVFLVKKFKYKTKSIDKGFPKINIRSQSGKVDFFHWVIFRRTATFSTKTGGSLD
jgi:hypothetical protein